eukprot:g3115.t1
MDHTNEENSKSLFLHPLAIVSISSMYTRCQIDRKLNAAMKIEKGVNMPPRLIGCIIGYQSGSEYHICDNFEFPYSFSNGKYEVDADGFQQRVNLLKMVHSDWEILGWYSVNGEAQASLSAKEAERKKAEDCQIHKTLRETAGRESFLFMEVFGVGSTDEELPIHMYDENWRDDSAPTRRVQFKMKSDKAEGIAMDHVSKVKAGKDSESEFVTQLKVTQSSLAILNDRIRMVKDYLISIQRDGKEKNHSLIREISSVCNRLPVCQSKVYLTHCQNEHNDTFLLSYLAAVTKTAALCNDVLDKFHSTRMNRMSLKVGRRPDSVLNLEKF